MRGAIVGRESLPLPMPLPPISQGACAKGGDGHSLRFAGSVAISLALHLLVALIIFRQDNVETAYRQAAVALPVLKLDLRMQPGGAAPLSPGQSARGVPETNSEQPPEDSSPARLLAPTAEGEWEPVFANTAGSVRFRITVSAYGQAVSVVAEDSNLPQEVIQALLDDLHRARYQPARRLGRPVISDMVLVIELEEAPGER